MIDLSKIDNLDLVEARCEKENYGLQLNQINNGIEAVIRDNLSNREITWKIYSEKTLVIELQRQINSFSKQRLRDQQLLGNMYTITIKGMDYLVSTQKFRIIQEIIKL